MCSGCSVSGCIYRSSSIRTKVVEAATVDEFFALYVPFQKSHKQDSKESSQQREDGLGRREGGESIDGWRKEWGQKKRDVPCWNEK